jgi:Holliday junction resolvase
MQIIEGKLIFDFDFDAIKFDDTAFYRNHFSRITNAIKAVDIVAVNKEIGYLIEIKDYTYPNTKNLSMNELIEAVINKVISTLAAILPMKISANSEKEKSIAHKVSIANEIKVIVHIELPPKRRTLKQSNWDLSDLQIQLGRRLRTIDAHPKVVSKDKLQDLPWIVE